LKIALFRIFASSGPGLSDATRIRIRVVGEDHPEKEVDKNYLAVYKTA
jgi:hypothetical protein